jgi:transcriptional regulator with XRE-family HTH domain
MKAPQPIAEQLRKAIKRSSKSRYRISQESGIDQGALSRFVNRKRDLSLASVDAVCRVLDLQFVLKQVPRRAKPSRE